MTLKEYCAGQPSSRLLDQWAKENGALTPGMVLVTSQAAVWWRCSCGHTWRDTVKNRLLGVGCPACEGTQKPIIRRYHPRADLTGRQFGRLEVLSRAKVERESYWRCRCVCGGEAVVSQSCLTLGRTTSCGCLQDEVRKQNFEKHIHFVEGTCIEKIAAKTTAKNNTSGFRGVSKRSNGRFRATITFKGKRYDLGTYLTLDQAIEARLAGEVMMDEFVEKFQSERAARA